MQWNNAVGLQFDRRFIPALAVLMVLLPLSDKVNVMAAGDDQKAAKVEAPVEEAKPLPGKKDKDGWIALFNGKDLEGWHVTDFGGQGEVLVDNGEVVIEQGAALSGLHTDRKVPRVNYEVQYEAQRAAGSDFFAGLTFPVKDKYCSLILGGWGGGVVGLSSLDGMDASENETTTFQNFEKGTWYKIRIVVTDDKIDAWINDDHVVDVETQYHKISVRFEVERSQPFGFSTWQTTGRIRNARIRELPPAKAADAPATE